MIKTIIVADEAVHAFLGGVYPQWDIQTPVTSVDALWKGLEMGVLSPESEAVIFSDQYRDMTNNNRDLELAIATMAAHACVMVIAYDPTSASIIKEVVDTLAIENGIEQGMVYFITPDNPTEDIDAALIDYRKNQTPYQAPAASPPVQQQQPVQPVQQQFAPQRTNVVAHNSYSHEIMIDESKSEKKGMIFAFTSSKGGTGKSSTAIMTALALREASKAAMAEGKTDRVIEVCVVDLDIRDGQLGFIIGITEPTALNIRVLPNWTPEVIRQHLVYPERLGFHCLLAPKRARSAEDTPPNFYADIIQKLSMMFDVVILDTSVNYTDKLLDQVAYPLSDAILFVTDLGVSSVFGMTRWSNEITLPKERGGPGINPDKIGVVVNKSMQGVNMTRNSVDAASLGAPILVAVPSRPEQYVQAVNSHRLDLLLTDPKLASVYYKLADKIAGNRFPLSSFITEGNADSAPPQQPQQQQPQQPQGRQNPVQQQARQQPTGHYPGYSGPTSEQAVKKKPGLFGKRS